MCIQIHEYTSICCIQIQVEFEYRVFMCIQIHEYQSDPCIQVIQVNHALPCLTYCTGCGSLLTRGPVRRGVW